MLIPSIRDLAQFSAERFTPVTLARTEYSDMKVVGLEAGQAIPVHHPRSDLTLVVIQGEVTLVSGDEELAHAGPGAVLHARAGAARGVHAEQRSILVVVACPPPTAADHGELAAHFAAGTWR